MPSPITQNIGSAVSAVGLGNSVSPASAREAATAASTTQVAQTIQVAAEKTSTRAVDDKRRSARAPAARVEGGYSPQNLKKRPGESSATEEKQAAASSDGEASNGKLDTVA
jgi:hypothetical protein